MAHARQRDGVAERLAQGVEVGVAHATRICAIVLNLPFPGRSWGLSPGLKGREILRQPPLESEEASNQTVPTPYV